MHRRLRALAGLCAAAALLAAGPARAAPSDNVSVVASIPAMKSAISLNFIGDTMFVSTVHGVYSYDVSDPAKAAAARGPAPVHLGERGRRRRRHIERPRRSGAFP